MVDNQSSLASDDNSMGVEDFDVIVIGAGLTGLTAARNLAAENYKVLIFESSDRVGGRAWTKRFPGSSVNVDMGGEFYDVNCHHHTVAEVKRQNLPIERLGYQDSTAWFFAYPGRAYITPATCHPDFKQEYERAMHQINEDIGRINFREGLEQGAVMFLDVPFAEYVRERCKTTTKFVQEYLLSEAFTMFHADPEALSALSVLHCLAGFGTPEEILNTRPRLGEPFKKPEYARVGEGLGALAERIANEFIALGGEIRFNSAIGTIVCEPVPTQGSKRYCAICTCSVILLFFHLAFLFLFVMSLSASLLSIYCCLPACIL
jgi:phytoene dehydrogenase-like protein